MQSCIRKNAKLVPGALPNSISPVILETKVRKMRERTREARTPSQTRGPKGFTNYQEEKLLENNFKKILACTMSAHLQEMWVGLGFPPDKAKVVIKVEL